MMFLRQFGKIHYWPAIEINTEQSVFFLFLG